MSTIQPEIDQATKAYHRIGMISKLPTIHAVQNRNGARLYPERLARGERVAGAKLTPEIVREIRLSNKSDSELAFRLKVHRDTIARVRMRLTWAHIP